jgi:hypothetical protein
MSSKPNRLDKSEMIDATRDQASGQSSHEGRPRADAPPETNAKPANASAKAAAGLRQPPVTIDPEFFSYLQQLSPTEEALLEQSLRSEGGARDPLVVWKGPGILLDGHHRYALCLKHGLPYSITEIELPDRAAALAWIDRNQGGRRNDTPEGLSYRRGRHYCEERRRHGGSRTGGQAGGHDDHLKTEERLAALYKVSARTIRRDAEFAQAVAGLASACGEEIRRFILTRQAKLTHAAVVRLSLLPPAARKKAVLRLLETGKLPTKPRSRTTSTRPFRLPPDPAALARMLKREWDGDKRAALRKAMGWDRKDRVENDVRIPMLGWYDD